MLLKKLLELISYLLFYDNFFMTKDAITTHNCLFINLRLRYNYSYDPWFDKIFINHFTFQYQCRIMTIMIVPLLFWLIGQKRWRELPDYRILQEEIKCSGRDLNPGSSPWEGEMLNRTTPPELRHNEFDLHIKLMSSYVYSVRHIYTRRREVLKFFKLFVNSYLQYLSITVPINFYSIASSYT